MVKQFRIISLVLAVLFFAGCAKDLSPDTYAEANVGEMNRVFRGVILDIRAVTVKGNSGVGGGAGAAAGAMAGASAGGSGLSAGLAGVAGGVVGGVIGHKVDEAVNTQKALQYMIELKDGKVVSVVQGPSELAIGQHVMVVYGAETKIILDKTYYNGLAQAGAADVNA